VNFWTGGVLALEGRVATLYDRDAYDALVKSLFPPATGFLSFSYPPHILPLLSGLALLPYGAALALWQLFGLGSFLAVSLNATNRDKVLPYVILSPIVILVITVGQASFFLAALFVGAFRLMPRRPIAAGGLLGLLTVKPQLGLLLPLALIWLGEWRALVAAAVTTVALVVVSIVCYGLGPWQDYVVYTLPFQQRVITAMVGLYPTMMITPYAGLWWLGLPAQTALALHGVATLVIGFVSLRILGGSGPAALKVAILAVASVIATPYCLNYDLAIPAAAILCWVALRAEPLTPGTLGALGLFWLLPYFSMALVLWKLPVMPFVVLALFCALVHEAWRHGMPLAAVPVAAGGE
jgi:hypothetical protein